LLDVLGACGGLLDSLLLGHDEVLLFGYLVDEEVDEALDSGTVACGNLGEELSLQESYVACHCVVVVDEIKRVDKFLFF